MFDAGRILVAVAMMLPGLNPALAQSSYECGPLKNAYGPYDYTNPEHFAENLPIVEQYHFDAGVEQLRGVIGVANSSARLADDLDYTLRAFPNHHRALYAMVRYYLTKVPAGSKKLHYSAECYFDRALRLSPGDPTVRLIGGYYYQKTGDQEMARQHYEAALEIAPNSAEVQYNVGLWLFDLKEYDRARSHAVKAYDLGYPLPGLRNKLRRVGAWEEVQTAEN